MKLLVKNIGLLVNAQRTRRREAFRGAEMREMPTLNEAWLLVEEGRVKDFGSMSDCPVQTADTTVVDAEGGAVFPSFCDSHTHIVYADSREREFVDKICGLSYAEMARRGGGILNSADRLHELSEDELFTQATRRVEEVIRKGTGAIEIKSGYGHYHRSDAYKAMDILEEYGLPTLRFSHYGERRSVDATEEEMKMFQFLRDMFEDAGFDPSQLELVRKSDDYVSAVVGDWDLARLKFTERAAWIIFPYAEHKAMKHRIYFPEEIVVMTDLFDAQVKALATHTELKHMD